VEGNPSGVAVWWRLFGQALRLVRFGTRGSFALNHTLFCIPNQLLGLLTLLLGSLHFLPLQFELLLLETQPFLFLLSAALLLRVGLQLLPHLVEPPRNSVPVSSLGREADSQRNTQQQRTAVARRFRHVVSHEFPILWWLV